MHIRLSSRGRNYRASLFTAGVRGQPRRSTNVCRPDQGATCAKERKFCRYRFRDRTESPLGNGAHAEWKDDGKFDGMFRKLIDGLQLFYKG